MTQSSEQPINRIDRLEIALGKLAEISTQNFVRYDRAIESLTINVDRLVAENAEARQQAALDRQEMLRIWEYLHNRNGGSAPPTQDA